MIPIMAQADIDLHLADMQDLHLMPGLPGPFGEGVDHGRGVSGPGLPFKTAIFINTPPFSSAAGNPDTAGSIRKL